MNSYQQICSEITIKTSKPLYLHKTQHYLYTQTQFTGTFALESNPNETESFHRHQQEIRFGSFYQNQVGK